MLDELFELARWAPNHNLTNPWRFRVLGPEALAALKEAAGPEAAAKLDRAPTLVVVSAPCATRIRCRTRRTCWPTGCAAYIVLLGRARPRAGRLLALAGGAAHARGARRLRRARGRARRGPRPPRRGRGRSKEPPERPRAGGRRRHVPRHDRRDRARGGPARRGVRPRGGGRRHHRRRRRAGRRHAAATASRWSSAATTRSGPRAAPASSSTAGCATSRTSTSGSSARRCWSAR